MRLLLTKFAYYTKMQHYFHIPVPKFSKLKKTSKILTGLGGFET